MNSLLVKQTRPEIDPADPWADDIFERKSTGERLARLIENTPNNFVLAVKAPFGAGKTVFLDRLSKHLNKTMPAVTLDAWENDYLDPMDALLVALHNRAKTINSVPLRRKALNHVKKAIEHAPRVIKFLGRAVLAAKTFGASELAAGVYDAATDIVALDTTAVDSGLDLLKLVEKKESSSKCFRAELQKARSKLLESIGVSEGKLVFIIDELDRCRPDFSIKMLEHIKHFFNEPGIVFILTLDNDNLSLAVQTLYGPNVDGERYLRKFFDMEFFLPPASPQANVINLMIRHGHARSKGDASQIFTTLKNDIALERQSPNHRSGIKGEYDHTDIPSFTIALTDLSIAYNLSIRDQIQIMTALTAVIRSSAENQPLLPYILSLGLVCRFADAKEFTDIVTGKQGLSRWYAENERLPMNRKSLNSNTAKFLHSYLRFGNVSHLEFNNENSLHNWEPYGDDMRVRIQNEYAKASSFFPGKKTFDEYICDLLNIAGTFITPREE